MSTLLLRNADVLATFNDSGDEFCGGSVFCRDGVIECVGDAAQLPTSADNVLDMRGHAVLPGLVNTHHHLFQSMTRVMAQNAGLFDWLKALYPVWSHLQAEHMYSAAAIGLAELALSGCTTSSDHQYIFPGDSQLEDSIRAAADIGMRFHAARGSMSVGESKGGLPPDNMTENEADILKDCERVISAWHDPSRYAMLRIVLAPCSPFSVSCELMRDSAELARQYRAGLHTHLAENREDIAYSRAHFNQSPSEYVRSLGWTGKDVWHAHCVMFEQSDIALFADTSTSVAHCPCSNMRLGSGIAPLRDMLDAGVTVGLGVDGSASNDSGDLINEARQAMLLQRVVGGAGALTARQALMIATRGGAQTLNRDDIGILAPGYAADFACFNLDIVQMSGAHADPLAALVFCGVGKAAYTIVNGIPIVEQGQLISADLGALLARHKQLAAQLPY